MASHIATINLVQALIRHHLLSVLTLYPTSHYSYGKTMLPDFTTQISYDMQQ